MFKDGVFYVLGELVSKAVPFLILPYLSRFLGLDGISDLIYYTSIVAVIILLLGISQDGAISRYYFRYGRRTIGLPISVSFFYSLIAFIFITCIAIYLEDLILLVCSLTSFTSVIMTTQLVYQQCKKNALVYFLLQLVHAFVSLLALFFIFEYVKASTEGRIFSIALANLVCVILSAYLISKDNVVFRRLLTLHNMRLALGFLFAFGAPLLLHQFSIISKNHLDKIILSELLDKNFFGLYAISFQVATALSVFLVAVNKAALPYYFEALKQDRFSIVDLRFLVFLGGALFQIPALVSLVIPDQFYVFVFGDDFSGIGMFLPGFLCGFGLMAPYLVLVNFLFYKGEALLITISTVASSLLYLALLVFFASFYLDLIVYTLFVSNIFLVVFLLYFVERRFL